ncbi:pyrroline-5-carboxylate dehydrogenase [Thiopseudomonas alkaliphila]|uniref:bifunctional proline dehydrogenase/L-glutamate gamma-semialdehyde dehydrogenase PutA n=1 Tax=Thiopseudomonas alkaliphila TaxID=1697053 RepID=UPI00069ED2A9|nr:bifunctional proline dehydrogenase/L-glutamate gamma-semialdehyde dehydrogenase PutA [Thiopseudomonas alkaliphila]AKX45605.1 pyrroline-5-carboxylate dehydrogenase [Thiopseudomonas alkaliphila]
MFQAQRLLKGLPELSAAAFFPQISANYAPDETAYLEQLIQLLNTQESEIQGIQQHTQQLIEQVRGQQQKVSLLDQLLREYSLDTQEGLMLMCLAEALLRVPDKYSMDALISDRFSAAQWQQQLGQSDSWLVNFAAWSLRLTGKLVQPTRALSDPPSMMHRLLSRSAEPVIRQALRKAMKIMGEQFVLGQTMAQALHKGKRWVAKGYDYSFDMLGEAALTAADAAAYWEDYRAAIEAVGRAQLATSHNYPSISIKLSALHPRYEVAQQQRVLSELFTQVRRLALQAKQQGVAITIDAEEADRLELSLLLFEQLIKDPELSGWGQLGIVVQAYSKRCLPVLVWLTLLTKEQATSIPVRLVKGAYWDTEIKHSQVQGLAGYPVFTRKEGTDVSYLAAARFLLSAATEGALYPQFATHNAHTVCSILQFAGHRAFEFQRLHGMGDALYDQLLQQHPGQAVRIYAPVGAHQELLPYLVRRLLENGANSSFVHQLQDPRIPIAQLTQHPLTRLSAYPALYNDKIVLPSQIFYGLRTNSQGINMNIQAQWSALEAEFKPQLTRQWQAAPMINGEPLVGEPHTVVCPFNTQQVVGQVQLATASQAAQAMAALEQAWPAWNATAVEQRAAILLRCADLLEQHRAELMALCCLEAGKSLQDGIDEVREAVDFCRYYAQQAEQRLQSSELLGPTGERNTLFYQGRGVFACISPWNFPLAIFLGQISAALVAGNTVLAKPAEQTSLVAQRAIELLFEAGLPTTALAFLPGSGNQLGAVFCHDARLAGVCFTGSTQTARQINQRLADKPGMIARLVAETGGQNAMIVDSTALPEQVVQDVLASAFTSAGQRCSALRVLYLQEEIADTILRLLTGALQELSLGPSCLRETDVGPVIDRAAQQRLLQHIELFQQQGRLLAQAPLPKGLLDSGYFVQPSVLQLAHLSELSEEHFGPILHVRRYPAQQLAEVLEEINSSGFGLTLGVHSRNQQTADFIEQRAKVGNLYVNRNQIGAAVGVQPFGGQGLSGTGPKAGGPNYLFSFITERVTTTNTAAIGGNASLLSLQG